MSDFAQTELGMLPANWRVQRLGDLSVKIQDGTHFSPTSTTGPYRYITSKNIRFGQLDLSDCGWISEAEHLAIYARCDVRAGDVLLTKDGVNTGNAALNTLAKPFSLLSSVAFIRTDDLISNSPFVLQYLLSPQGQQRIKDLMAGNAITRLTLAKIKDFRIPVPPIQQQRRIATILTTIDNLIEKTETLISKYQSVKQGLMYDLFTRGLDEHGHLRPPYAEAPDLYKESELGWIPKEWDAARVDEVGSVQLGRQRSPKHQSGRFTTPYLRVANVFDGWIDYSDILEMDFTPREKQTYSVLPGDIFLNEGQSLELVGRSAVYEGNPDHYCFQNTLVRFRAYEPNDHRFCQGIFKFWLDTGAFTTIARQTTSVAHLGADRFAAKPFPHPNANEQRRISAVLQWHDHRAAIEQKYLDKLRATKTALMQDLLTGKVRVKVDKEA